MENAALIKAGHRAQLALSRTIIAGAVIAFLWWARSIFIPIALAIFLTLLLTPLVRIVQRRGLGRTFSVILVVVFVGLVTAGVVSLVWFQFSSLIDQLPKHSENIKEKIRSLRQMGEGAGGGRLQDFIRDLASEWNRSSQTPSVGEARLRTESAGAETEQEPVVVQPTQPAWTERIPQVVAQVLAAMLSLGLAFVLMIFILLRRESLRNRMIALAGGNLITTTKALDEATERISRYLRTQLMINTSYGVVLGAGLYFIGLNYALLWGFLAALLRYIPYVGPWLSALLPLTLAIAQFDGWTQLLLIIGLVFVLELVENYFVEPILYGHSLGVSEVALLVAAAFWTFLWGPVGLILSGPLTVCLVAVGRYFEQFRVFVVLFGDEDVLPAKDTFYQRLIARDQDEATELALTAAKEMSLVRVFDEMMLPALVQLKDHRANNEVTQDDERFTVQAMREIIDDAGEAVAKRAQSDSDAAGIEPHSAPHLTDSPRLGVLGYPARDDEDYLALSMLGHALAGETWELQIVSVETLASELVDLIQEHEPLLIVVASLPPGGLARSRHICKRLRARFPELKILVGRWGLTANVETNESQLLEAGADAMVTRLEHMIDQMDQWLPVLHERRMHTVGH